jgi:2-acylglycerol O-acyltransferase 2
MPSLFPNPRLAIVFMLLRVPINLFKEMENIVQFAPLSVPFPRRIQTASIVCWIALLPTSIILFFITLYSSTLLPFCLAYLVFVYLDPSPEMGGRTSMMFRRLSFWKAMRDFFPIRLVKTSDLDPSKNYVFGYHPYDYR